MSLQAHLPQPVEFQKALMESLQGAFPEKIQGSPKHPEQGLAKLVLTVVELLRRLCEKQALRRMDSGSLTEEEIDRLGDTFLRLEKKMEELKKVFGLEGEDLNMNLGPLGNLM
jgi:hypothetical protein